MKLSRLTKIAGLSCAALLLTAGGVVAAIPTLRHFAMALAHDPSQLPSVLGDDRVRFEPGAEDCAFSVAALLPAAIADIEAAHGRKFRSAPMVGVYSAPQTYAEANGLGSAQTAGVSFLGRVSLSPALCGPDRARLRAVLTHELSHAHLQSWLSPLSFVRLPTWFNEGLAVMVSDGGGAESVSEGAAREAISKGHAIAITDEGSVFNLTAVNFVQPPPRRSAFEGHLGMSRLAYRQAAMFVSWLRRRDELAFREFLQRIEDGRSFRASFEEAFGGTPHRLWDDFVAQLDGPASHAEQPKPTDY